jgi:hypothetical protein
MDPSKNLNSSDDEDAENEDADEWSRALSNPDNVIISDSLSGLLSPEDLAPVIVNEPQIALTCVFEFDDYVLGGTLSSYSDAEGIRTYAFITQMTSIYQILKRSNLVSAAIAQTGIPEPVEIEVNPETDVGVSVHIQSGTTALVTVSFSDPTT